MWLHVGLEPHKKHSYQQSLFKTMDTKFNTSHFFQTIFHFFQTNCEERDKKMDWDLCWERLQNMKSGSEIMDTDFRD